MAAEQVLMKNPWNDTRSCNGSSGGEGGILGSQCSGVVGENVGGDDKK